MGRLIALGDIHGCFDPLYELLFNKVKLNKSDHLVMLGDYIDRGNKIKDVIDFIIDLKGKDYNLTLLLGNHEAMLLDSYKNHESFPLWLMNDGYSTLESFGIDDIDDMPSQYLDFFKSLEYYKIIGNFIFVHAGLSDEATDPFSDLNGMLWESRREYHNPVLKGKTIVHGHRPKTLEFVKHCVEEKSHVLPIDTGCVYDSLGEYGFLTALDVSDMTLYSVRNF
jgi:serine/threonine protein phosphatase 1